MLSTAITLAAETSEHGEPAVHPYVIGAIALGILLLLVRGNLGKSILLVCSISSFNS